MSGGISVCGFADSGNTKAEKEPVSFSRFVLPFRYQPYKHEVSRVADSPFVYEEFHKGIRDFPFDRRAYLLNTTADILFSRAKWFKIKKSDGQDWENKLEELAIPGQELPVNVVISAPSLVLFEWGAGTKNGSQECDDDKTDYSLLKTGFLILEIQFAEDTALKDMMYINEFYRYIARPYPSHGVKMAKMFGEPVLTGKDGETTGICPDTCKKIYFDRWNDWLGYPVKIGNDEWDLFPDENWREKAWEYLKDSCEPPDDVKKSAQNGNAPTTQAQDPKGEKKESWIAHDDNRAFTWTCAVVDRGGDRLKDYFGRAVQRSGGKIDDAWRYGHWIKLLNVDAPSGDDVAIHKSRKFEQKWAEKRTYTRWQEWGTFYGYTSHSGVALVPPVKDDPPLWKHMRDMYFDQALLLLYLRTSIFRLSEKLNNISADAIAKRSGPDGFRDPFLKLRSTFLHITNMYQYPILSNQQQALEMYEIFREELDIKTLFGEVKEKIESGHEFIENNATTQLNDNMARIALVGGAIAVTATVGQFFGISDSTASGCSFPWMSCAWWGKVAISVCIGIGAWFVFNNRLPKSTRKTLA